MTDHIQASIKNHIGFLTLTRPQALNALSLDMIRAMTPVLLAWRDDPDIRAVLIRSDSPKAFCAGGDIRFFYSIARTTPRGGSALLEDFFTEEYALNHLIHNYPKPYIALMDGIVMGGGMGISQSGPSSRARIVTERTRMAMPEVNIGIFPDVGGSYFLTRAPGQIGTYLGVTGQTITAADALYANLADVFIPSIHLPALTAFLESQDETELPAAIHSFAQPFQNDIDPNRSVLAMHRTLIDRVFSQDNLTAITKALAQEPDPYAQEILTGMHKRSPLMMCVTLEQLRRGASMSIAECLRMERGMVRHCFEQGEVLEGIRAVVIDKDNAPLWSPASLDAVTAEMVESFFVPAWPPHAHPLRELQ